MCFQEDLCKRTERHHDMLNTRKEEKERTSNLDNVQDCISRIEALKEPGKKYKTQPKSADVAWKGALLSNGRERTRSLGSNVKEVPENMLRKRSNRKPPFSSSSISFHRSDSDKGSFLDLLFSSDEEHVICIKNRFKRSQSVNTKHTTKPIDIEKRKINRGFPTGNVKVRPRIKSSERNHKVVSDVAVIKTSHRSRRCTVPRDTSKRSTSSSSTTPSPSVEFQRPDLFDQLRYEKQLYPARWSTERHLSSRGRNESGIKDKKREVKTPKRTVSEEVSRKELTKSSSPHTSRQFLSPTPSSPPQSQYSPNTNSSLDLSSSSQNSVTVACTKPRIDHDLENTDPLLIYLNSQNVNENVTRVNNVSLSEVINTNDVKSDSRKETDSPLRLERRFISNNRNVDRSQNNSITTEKENIPNLVFDRTHTNANLDENVPPIKYSLEVIGDGDDTSAFTSHLVTTGTSSTNTTLQSFTFSLHTFDDTKSDDIPSSDMTTSLDRINIRHGD